VIKEMRMLPTRILLASDGSEEAARAARTAIELSKKLGAELHLVYLGRMPSDFYEPPDSWELDIEFRSKMEERIHEEAIARHAEEVQSIREAGGKVVQVHAKIGRPDAEIVKLAKELSADTVTPPNTTSSWTWLSVRSTSKSSR
jgi:nucleotide-binding universal stress UspA family protein